MKILIIDTASKIRLGLAEDNNLIENMEEEHHNNSVELIDLNTKKLLALKDLTIKDIQLIIIGIGPGSHTGLRIGMAFSKALSQTLSVPLIGVESKDDFQLMLNLGFESYSNNKAGNNFEELIPKYFI